VTTTPTTTAARTTATGASELTGRNRAIVGLVAVTIGAVVLIVGLAGGGQSSDRRPSGPFAWLHPASPPAGWNVARRSELRVDAEPRHDVVVLDTIGELAQLYQVATAVFVGGSLVDSGGHNILEPAVFGKPIVFGPYMHNFAEIARTFLDNDAAVQVRTGRELDTVLLELLGDPVRRARLGAAARALVEANRGARTKTLSALAQLLPPDDPANVVRPFRRV